MIGLVTMKQRRNSRINQQGFTMIEMVAVLIVMAIMAAGITSRVTTTGNELIVETEILKSHLRFAQIRAMNDTVSWGINVNDASSYTLYKGTDQAPDILPGESGQTHTLPTGVTITAGLERHNFNEWGKPVNAVGAELTGTQTITLTQETATSTITITQNTGYVQ